MSDALIAEISKWLVIITFISSALFCAIYQLVAQWRDNEFGITLMIYQLAMTGVLGTSAFTTFIGPHVWLTYFGLVVFALVPLALIGRTWVLIRARLGMNKK